MRDIFKSSMYRVFCGKEFIYSLIVSVLLNLAFAVSQLSYGGDIIETISSAFSQASFFTIIALMFFVGLFIGGDIKSKILFYEVMSGHTRVQVFTGRFLCGLLNSIIIAIFSLASLVLPIVLLDGAGDIFNNIGHFILRLAIILVIFLFYITLISVASFTTKSVVGGLGISWIAIIVLNFVSFLDMLEINIASYPISLYFGFSVFGGIMTLPISWDWVSLTLCFYLLGTTILGFIGTKLFSRAELA